MSASNAADAKLTAEERRLKALKEEAARIANDEDRGEGRLQFNQQLLMQLRAKEKTYVLRTVDVGKVNSRLLPCSMIVLISLIRTAFHVISCRFLLSRRRQCENCSVHCAFNVLSRHELSDCLP